MRVSLAYGGYPFYHLAVLALHILAALLAGFLALRAGAGALGAVFAALLFGVHQTNALAVLSLDGAGQTGCVAFGGLALVLLWTREEAPGAARSALAASALLVSMLWKDAGAGFAAAAAILWLRYLPSKPVRALAGLLLLTGVVGLYGWMRWRAGALLPSFGGATRYDLQLGWNLAKNAGMLLASLASPIASTQVVARSDDPYFMALAAALAIGSLGFVVVGVRAVIPVLLFATLLLPDALLARVSELYAYKPALIFAAVAGVAVARSAAALCRFFVPDSCLPRACFLCCTACRPRTRNALCAPTATAPPISRRSFTRGSRRWPGARRSSSPITKKSLRRCIRFSS
ncbi:MAG: hypothetical protein M5R36_08820 [Deltaproteobacteria bacterium]|nr:hypothetical protein [Deltaproteobacteria bacterium]